jgi:hypothetical protein
VDVLKEDGHSKEGCGHSLGRVQERMVGVSREDGHSLRRAQRRMCIPLGLAHCQAQSRLGLASARLSVFGVGTLPSLITFRSG